MRSGESGGTRNSRTSNVAAIANTPSLNASSRLVRKRPLCGVDRVGHRADQQRSAWLLIAEVGVMARHQDALLQVSHLRRAPGLWRWGRVELHVQGPCRDRVYERGRRFLFSRIRAHTGALSDRSRPADLFPPTGHWRAASPLLSLFPVRGEGAGRTLTV